MTDEFIRPPATIQITGPDDGQVHTIELPELAIVDPYPQERDEFDHYFNEGQCN